MGENPPPLNFQLEQVICDQNGPRIRREEERTAAGDEISHHKFIIAAPVGVSASIMHRSQLSMFCARMYHTDPEQVSLRGTARPGRAGASLKCPDFKHSRHTYALISRQSPNIVWLEQMMPSNPCVKAYVQRHKEEYPDQRYLDHGDTFDAWCVDFDHDRERKEDGFFASSAVPKKQSESVPVHSSTHMHA